MNAITPIQKKSIRFRARSFVAFALVPKAPIGEWLEALDGWTENSPGFFAGRPVVLDLNQTESELSDIRRLVSELAARGIRVYAIEANGFDALDPDLPPLLVGARATVIDEEPDVAELPAEAEAPVSSSTLIIEQPVRSGQSIFHPHGDVVVIGSTGSGSEIIAGGSVHVYGTLRGRAFAGAAGNDRAHIFCQKNEAELLVLDGWYRTAEDMDPSTRGKPIHAFLENGMIRIVTLN